MTQLESAHHEFGKRGAALVVMHTRAAPRERMQDPRLYGDITAEVRDFLRDRIAVALWPTHV